MSVFFILAQVMDIRIKESFYHRGNSKHTVKLNTETFGAGWIQCLRIYTVFLGLIAKKS